MVKLTMLNSMAGSDFIQSLNQQKEWGISVLDLKDKIYGKSITELTSEEAEQAAHEIRARGMMVYCFSTELFYDDIELGEHVFKTRYLARIEQTISAANILKPTVIRLLAARSSKRHEFANSVEYVNQAHPWLIRMYREAIDAIYAAGFQVTIENECHECIFANPEEIIAFFKELDRSEKVYFTYDVQNLWEMGTYPSIEVYRQLSPLIGFYHVKGGQKEENGQKLEWNSSLEDASWSVVEMTQLAVDDGISPVICINPCHGKRKDGYNYEQIFKRDLNYLRQTIHGVE